MLTSKLSMLSVGTPWARLKTSYRGCRAKLGVRDAGVTLTGETSNSLLERTKRLRDLSFGKRNHSLYLINRIAICKSQACVDSCAPLLGIFSVSLCHFIYVDGAAADDGALLRLHGLLPRPLGGDRERRLLPGGHAQRVGAAGPRMPGSRRRRRQQERQQQQHRQLPSARHAPGRCTRGKESSLAFVCGGSMVCV